MRSNESYAEKAAYIRILSDTYDCVGGGYCPDVGGGGRSDKFGSNHMCSERMNAVLDELELDRSTIKSVKIWTRSGASYGNEPAYQARIRLNSCGGMLYIDFNDSCRPKQTYTRGVCQIAGVSGY